MAHKVRFHRNRQYAQQVWITEVPAHPQEVFEFKFSLPDGMTMLIIFTIWFLAMMGALILLMSGKSN